MKLSDIATRLDCELHGDGDIDVSGLQPVDEAGSHDLTFVSNKKYFAKLPNTRAAAVILPTDAPPVSLPSLRTDNPELAVATVLGWFSPAYTPPEGIHPTAVIAESARIGTHASVGPYAVIGDRVEIGAHACIFAHVVVYPDARIGDHFTAHAGAVVRERVTIGNRVVLQSGVVVGGDGFGYVPLPDGSVMAKPQAGTVELQDAVEIGANTTVDRATTGTTRIRTAAKIDNLVQIGHGSDVGRAAFVCAQVGLAGSTTLGDRVQLGGQVGVAGHLTVGENSQVVAQSGIPNDVPANSVIGGYPAVNVLSWRRTSAALPKLPALLRRVRKLEQELAALKKESAT